MACKDEDDLAKQHRYVAECWVMVMAAKAGSPSVLLHDNATAMHAASAKVPKSLSLNPSENTPISAFPYH